MSYSLGQAKWIPGQIHFQTTRTGRIPSLQPLIEAGLPIAPYIEHGSYATGQPSIMRYGLDPYRGISGLPPARNVSEWMVDEISAGRCPSSKDAPAHLIRDTTWFTPLGQDETETELQRRADQAQAAIETIRSTLSPAVMIGTGAFVGAAAGISGGVLKSPLWGGLIGAVGGGVLGYLGWKNFTTPQTPALPVTGRLSGILAVL